jgi:hypothetical protein
MSHFAKVLNGKVIEVIVADIDFFKSFVDSTPGNWIQTSYNTYGNKHHNPITNEDDSDKNPPLRGNYAGIGFVYDAENDVFYEPQPYASWSLNKSTWLWEPPIPCPQDGNLYNWDETTKQWVLLTTTVA